MVRRLKLTVAYLGGGFCGWQRQPGRRTVQGELESTLARIVAADSRVPVTAAGRTDAGVHAAGQVVHVDLPATLPADSLQRALTQGLPSDLRVRSIRCVPDGFHARFDAVAKRYVYRLRWQRADRPWLDLRAAVAPAPVCVDTLARCVERLRGHRDVASFSVVDPDVSSTVRTVWTAVCRPGRHGVTIELVGDGFLRYQVRRMVGAALQVAAGQEPMSWFTRLLDQPTPGAAVSTAPPEGLTLERVWYRRPIAAGTV